jgi:hypothetical protein
MLELCPKKNLDRGSLFFFETHQPCQSCSATLLDRLKERTVPTFLVNLFFGKSFRHPSAFPSPHALRMPSLIPSGYFDGLIGE